MLCTVTDLHELWQLKFNVWQQLENVKTMLDLTASSPCGGSICQCLLKNHMGFPYCMLLFETQKGTEDVYKDCMHG